VAGEIGERRVYLTGDPGCTLTSSQQRRSSLDETSWTDPANWIPIGTAGSDSLAAGQRVPTALDDVCIGADELDRGDIVDLTGTSGVARSITGPDGYVALDRLDQDVPSSLVVSGDVELERFGALGASSASIGGRLEVVYAFVWGSRRRRSR
jgi:hypothetical protein